MVKGLCRSVATVAAVLAMTVLSPFAAAAPSVPDHDDSSVRLDDLDESIRDYAEELLHAHADAVDEALHALEEAEAELAAATEAYDLAAAEAAAARAADQQATHALEVNRRAQERAQAELAERAERIAEATAQLGFVARAAYQAGGSLAGWSAGGGDAFEVLAAERAARDAVQDRLHGLRTEQRQLAAVAGNARAAADAAAEALAAAESRLDASRADFAAATEAADAARAEEREQYDEFLAESEALEQWLAEYGLDEKLEGTGSFIRPATGRVTSAFGPRLHPILGYVRTHTGIDIGIGDGFIYAADHGVVVEATWSDGYGYFVVVDHGIIDGKQVSTLYAHQPGLSVDVGMPVAKGQPIGSIGSTGLSTGPHLHFEVRIGGAPVDPWPWIRSAPMPEPME